MCPGQASPSPAAAPWVTSGSTADIGIYHLLVLLRRLLLLTEYKPSAKPALLTRAVIS